MQHPKNHENRQSKRHHVIPQFYLKGFVNDSTGKIMVHDKINGNIYATNVLNCSVIQHYYSFEHEDGRRDDFIEKYFSKIESEASPIFEQLKLGNYSLSDEHQDLLVFFISILMFRNPKHRQSFQEFQERAARTQTAILCSSRDLMESHIRQLESKEGKKIDVDIDKLMEFGRDQSRYNIEIHPNSSLKPMLEISLNIYNVMRKMNWIFAKANGECNFIAGDFPIGMVNPKVPAGRPIGIGMQNTEVFFPISSQVCMIGSWHDMSTISIPAILSSLIIMGINESIVSSATRCFYSDKEQGDLFEYFKSM